MSTTPKLKLILEHTPNGDIAHDERRGYWTPPQDPREMTIEGLSIPDAKVEFLEWRKRNGLGIGNMTRRTGEYSMDGRVLGHFDFNGRFFYVDGTESAVAAGTPTVDPMLESLTWCVIAMEDPGKLTEEKRAEVLKTANALILEKASNPVAGATVPPAQPLVPHSMFPAPDFIDMIRELTVGMEDHEWMADKIANVECGDDSFEWITSGAIDFAVLATVTEASSGDHIDLAEAHKNISTVIDQLSVFQRNIAARAAAIRLADYTKAIALLKSLSGHLDEAHESMRYSPDNENHVRATCPMCCAMDEALEFVKTR